MKADELTRHDLRQPDQSDKIVVQERLAALDSYDVLDTIAEQGFDDIVHLAATICRTPVSLVSLVADDRQWFKARSGFEPCQTPLSESVCAYTLQEPDLLVIPDLTVDPRTRDNALVTGAPHIRFYAGAPLRTPEGVAVGALCVIDMQPRPGGLTAEQSSALQRLARQVMAQMELRRALAAQAREAAERRRAQDALQAAEAFHRRDALTNSILAAAPDCVKVLSLDGVIEFMNDRGVELRQFGAAEDVLGQELAAFWPQEERAGIRRAVAQAAAGHTARMEGSCPTAKGEPRWWDISFAPFRQAEDAPLRIVCISRDITARKLLEQQQAFLQDLLERLRIEEDPDAIMHAAAEAVGVYLNADRAGFYEVVSDDALRYGVGWTMGRMPILNMTLPVSKLGSGYLAGVSAGEWLAISDVASDPLTAGSGFGELGIAALIGFPILRGGQWQAGFYVNQAAPRAWTDNDTAVVREVAKQAWDAVERARARLAQRGAEETVLQLQKMEAVGQLTAGIAHDFNNLLASISGSLELIEMRVSKGRYAELDRYIRTARRGSERAAALTQRLLAFSRQQVLDPKPTNINRLVAGMEEMIRRTVGPAIEIEVVELAGLWNALIDPGQLENALLNLCINARDAMPNGGRITIETANTRLDEAAAKERDLPAGEYLSLSVTDTGTGMPPDVIARAFDPFFTTKPIGQGTGLGLSMIYGFARQSKGQVLIQSELSLGTKVRLYFPRHHGDGDAHEGTAATAAMTPAATGKTVLLVDDDPSVRMLVSEMLGDRGYMVIEAANGPRGIKIMESPASIDLLVTDVGLPRGMNGRQLAEAGRALRPGLKVLFITGYAEKAVVDERRLEPGMELLTKPFLTGALISRVERIIAAA